MAARICTDSDRAIGRVAAALSNLGGMLSFTLFQACSVG
jgi:hypothetical protein